jgi:MFS family permease
LAVGAVTAHLVAHLKEVGFSTLQAAMSLGLASAASIVGRVGFGLLAVRFQLRQLAVVGCLAQVVAFLILLTGKNPLGVYTYAIVFGISYGALAVALPVFVGAYYGRAHYTQILGIMVPVIILADAVGPILTGAIYDALGTYVPAFMVITGLSVIGLVCAMRAHPPNPKGPHAESDLRQRQHVIRDPAKKLG